MADGRSLTDGCQIGSQQKIACYLHFIRLGAVCLRRGMATVFTITLKEKLLHEYVKKTVAEQVNRS